MGKNEEQARAEAARVWQEAATFSVNEHGLVLSLNGEPEVAFVASKSDPDWAWGVFVAWLAGTGL